MEKMNPKAYYDVVIIGGGISGLSSSALLRRAGLSCCVIEKNASTGGYLQGFSRGSFRFDSAIHWLNNCGPDGFVARIFNFIGNDYPKALEQKRIRRFVSDDYDYLVTNNPDKLKDQWIKEFPHDKKGIIQFFSDARRIANSFESHKNIARSIETKTLLESIVHGMQMLRFIVPFIPHVKYTGKEGTKKGLEKYFTDPKLQNVFCAEPDLLSCLIPIAFAYSNDYQSPPKGGSQTYTEWLTYVTQHLEGDVLLNSKVMDILIEDQTACGVSFNYKGNIHKIKSKYVVAACDIETVFEKMLPPQAIPLKIKEKLKDAKLYASAFTVALGLDCPSEDLGFKEEIIFLADPDLDREELEGGDPYKSGLHILAASTRDKTLALPEQGTLTLFIPAWISNNNYWECEQDEQGNYIRGEKYRQLKEHFANVLIDRVQQKICPSLREHILVIDIATPITYLRYTGNKNGSMMGQKPGKENMQAGVASYKTPVKNLLRSGHWADLGGGVPIAVKSAINTTLMILKKENKPAFRLLADYIDGKKEIDSIASSNLFIPYNNSWKQELTPAQKAVERNNQPATNRQSN